MEGGGGFEGIVQVLHAIIFFFFSLWDKEADVFKMCTSFSKPRGCNWKVTWRLQGEYFLMFELQSDQPSLRLQSNMSPVLVEYKSHCACLLSQSCRVYFFFFHFLS